MRGCFLVLTALALLAPGVASAQEQERRVEFSAWSGFAWVFGNTSAPFAAHSSGIEGCPSCSQSIGPSGMLPVGVGLGLRYPKLLAGGFLQAGPAFCESRPCSGVDFMMGGGLQFHPAGAAPVDPWVGVAVGFEALPAVVAYPCCGGAFGALTGGVDFRTTGEVAVGPFLGASSSFLLGSGQPDSWALTTGWDIWLTAGIRVVADL